MEEAPTNFLLVFLLPFHLAGGVALGIALRSILKEGFNRASVTQNAFPLLWGSMFGGLPLVFGLAIGSAWIFLSEIAVFLGAIILTAVAYDRLRDLYSQPGMFVASFGLVFFLIGAALATTFLTGHDVAGLLIGLIFAGVGGIITLAGIWLLWHGR